jgi:hypothetical protein
MRDQLCGLDAGGWQVNSVSTSADGDIDSGINQNLAFGVAGQAYYIFGQAQKIQVGEVFLTQLNEIYTPGYGVFHRRKKHSSRWQRQLAAIGNVIKKRAPTGKESSRGFFEGAQFPEFLSTDLRFPDPRRPLSNKD